MICFKQVWGNDLLSERTKICVYQACPVASSLWQQVVDDLCQTRAATQQIPPPLPSGPAAHQVAGQSHQHRGPGARWLTEHAITAHSATPSMARPCTSHGA